ncbi:Glycosyl transferasefamily 25 [Penicillium lividum]|nr:Glycosyl transferasefamily 25 [Penicillium lividum]
MIPKASQVVQILLAGSAAYFLLRVLLTRSAQAPWTAQVPEFARSAFASGTYDHIHNETLGFEKVYAIGLPERTDKRDFLSVAASLSGFKVDWVDGVRPDSLIQKAMPKGINLEEGQKTIYAAWRAHMNVLTKVVENSISTALILEDDADWDVNLKSQLTVFADGLHTIKDNKHISRDAPYGTDWDVLWVGTCISGPSSDETHFYAIPHDPTVASIKQRGGAVEMPDSWTKIYPQDSTRYVYHAENGCCLYGYAVSNRGARRILAALSIDHLGEPVDNSLSHLCGGLGDRPKIDCYAPSPGIIGTYKRAGSAAQDSDIESYNKDSYHEARSYNMVYSAKQNIHRLVAGEGTVYNQWRDEPEQWQMKELELGKFQYSGGFLVDL